MPAKLPRTDTGIFNSAMAWRTASVACDKDTPGAKLKLKVSEGTPPSWLTDKAVLVSSSLAKADRGTGWPWLLMNISLRSELSSFKCWGANSSTTRYWFKGL